MFKVGQCVMYNGCKGKIFDEYKPFGTYSMYKIQMFGDGSIHNVSRHELVKSMPDNECNFGEITVNYGTTNQSKIKANATQTPIPQVSTSVCDMSSSASALNKTPTPVKDSSFIPQVSTTQGKQSSGNSRFVPMTDDEYFAFRNETINIQTKRKTESHIMLVQAFLEERGEQRHIETIPPEELNIHLSRFFCVVRQRDGREYEPSTLRGILGSIERYLRELKYPQSLVQSFVFEETRKSLRDKQKNLRSQGKGQKPNKADAITDNDIDILYNTEQLGQLTPTSIINTLWLNNTLHFGIRGGGQEHRRITWGDITLNYDEQVGMEYLEYQERQTKTRTGENIHDVRPETPRMYATPDQPDKCPVNLYKGISSSLGLAWRFGHVSLEDFCVKFYSKLLDKLRPQSYHIMRSKSKCKRGITPLNIHTYSDKRPATFCNFEDPFYIAPVTHVKNPRPNEQWFLRLPVGPKKIDGLMKKMAENANLPNLGSKRITNSSVRKYLCQKLLAHNIPDTHAVHITGHKNLDSLNNYRTLTNHQQREISNLLSNTKQLPPAYTYTNNPTPATSTTTCTESATAINLSQSQTTSVTQNLKPKDPIKSSIFSGSVINGGTFNISVNYITNKVGNLRHTKVGYTHGSTRLFSA